MKTAQVLELMRPRQWTKNLAVFAAIIFSGALGEADLVARTSLAFVALCLISSALYAANDALDAASDREHPIKKNRPVASGRMSSAEAFGVSAVLAVAGLTLSVLLGVPFAATVGAYLALHAAYTVWLKHIPIVDMLAISSGFVLRAVAGAVVIAVPVSPWLILCTGLLALFLASAKRRHEIVLLKERSHEHRRVLSEYSAELLDSFMVTLSAATVTSYALYTFFEERAPGDMMMLTIPFVVYGVLRYQYLVLKRGGGGQPEEVLLTDRPILAGIGLWAASAIFILYALPAMDRLLS